MYRLNEVMRAKTRVPVDLLKIDGTQLQGYVFAGSQERVLDLMNSREPFLPIELSDGQFSIMNKRVIQSITLLFLPRRVRDRTSPPNSVSSGV